ncbi:hypothetical protein HDE_11280 [Halotydeus destructor]|nr:hypothetical protein HDE_11280 [Halotydeus destructor]
MVKVYLAALVAASCVLSAMSDPYGHHGHFGPPPVPQFHYPSLPTIRIGSSSHHGSGGGFGGLSGWSGLKGMSIPSSLADKLFPFTIRIASHGEPHLPVVRVGHSPYRTSASLWAAPANVDYNQHVHHHPPPPHHHHPVPYPFHHPMW